MTWPRAFAVAESVWSPKEKKNWNNFVQRVEQQFKRYDIREINYARSMYDPIFTCTNNNGEPLISLSTEIEGLDIYYSFDNSFPDRFYPKYTSALTPPKDAVQLRTIVYKGNQPIGRMVTMPIDEINKYVDVLFNGNQISPLKLKTLTKEALHEFGSDTEKVYGRYSDNINLQEFFKNPENQTLNVLKSSDLYKIKYEKYKMKYLTLKKMYKL